MGKLGKPATERGKQEAFPRRTPTAIFSHSQGAPVEGTKPSVSDRLPCWGRWLGGSRREGEGEERGRRPASGSRPTAALSVKAGGG